MKSKSKEKWDRAGFARVCGLIVEVYVRVVVVVVADILALAAEDDDGRV